MKIYLLIPLIFLSACSTTPRLVISPQTHPSLKVDTVRYPEVVRAYHFGRYVDPGDDLVMHEQHVVYRVEENTRWDLQPLRTATGDAASTATTALPRDAAFNPPPVNDAVLAEVNAQKLATVQIKLEAKTLADALARFQVALQQTKTNLQEMAVLRVAVLEINKRLDALEAAQRPPPSSPNFPTNETPDSLSP